MVEKLYVIAVAPHTGAWIETPPPFFYTLSCPVAPHTGAWIETPMSSVSITDGTGRSPYGSVD